VKQQQLQERLNTPILPNAVRDSVLASGHARIAELLDILADENQWGPDEDAEGCASIHAATLLGELKAIDAIEPMLDVLGEVEIDGQLAMAAVDALSGMGRVVVDPVLRRNRESENFEVHFGYAEILARAGVQDERVFDLLCRELESDVAFGAALLGMYGDSNALDRLLHALDSVRLQPGKDEALRAIDIMEVCTAVEKLGGSLTAEQVEKRASASALLDALPDDEESEDDEGGAEPTQSVAEPEPFKWRGATDGHVHSASCNHGPQTPLTRKHEKIGPNEMCHCGSGKKYKKCHLFEDERNRFSST
jgi:hypothetical protein